MEGKYVADGNVIGRIGAIACLIAAAVLVGRLCGGGSVCPPGGRCFTSSSDKPAAR